MNLNVNRQFPLREIDDERMSMLTSTPITLIGEISSLMNARLLAGEDKHSLLQKSSRLIMLALAKKEGVTQLDLVRETYLKAPTISVTLQKLEKDGYVLRKPDNYDLRAVRVYLSENGRAYNEIMVKKIRAQEKEVLKCLSESENKQLMQLLAKLKDNMIDKREIIKF